MATTFLDASAIVKLVLHEPESQALIDFLDTRTGVEASELSIAEVGRAVRRFVPDFDEIEALDGIVTYDARLADAARAQGLRVVQPGR